MDFNPARRCPDMEAFSPCHTLEGPLGPLSNHFSHLFQVALPPFWSELRHHVGCHCHITGRGALSFTPCHRSKGLGPRGK